MGVRPPQLRAHHESSRGGGIYWFARVAAALVRVDNGISKSSKSRCSLYPFHQEALPCYVWDEHALQHRAMRVGMRRHVPVVSYRGSTALFHNTVDLAGDAADKSSRIHPRLSDDLLGFA